MMINIWDNDNVVIWPGKGGQLTGLGVTSRAEKTGMEFPQLRGRGCSLPATGCGSPSLHLDWSEKSFTTLFTPDIPENIPVKISVVLSHGNLKTGN